MIVGIGSDLIDIRRIEDSLERFGQRFIDRVFTEVEQAKAERRASVGRVRASTYAKRFAAKEACAKALGTGINHGVFWKDLAVVNLPGGKPTLQLSGGAAVRAAALVPDGMEPVVHLTMTDDYPLAQAFVIIEAVPRRASAGSPP